MKKFNWYMISKNRDAVYALAIICIMIFHCKSPKNIEGGLQILHSFKLMGNLGVDIFLFVSGISLYFAITKNSSWKRFYINRLKRVWIPTIIVLSVCYLYFVRDRRFLSYITYVTGIDMFIKDSLVIWFITCITVCYILYYFVYRLYLRTNWSIWALVAALAVSIGFNAVMSYAFPEFWKSTEIMWRRIPIFLVGSYMGKAVYDKKESRLSYVHVILLVIVSIISVFVWDSFIADYVSKRYLYLVMAVIFSMFFSIIGEVKQLGPVFRWLSPLTLEIYLVHERIIDALKMKHMDNDLLIMNMIAIVCALVVAKLLLTFEDKVIYRKK